MYLGKIVEIAERDQFFAEPKHPYSQALISAIPKPSRHTKQERILLKGDVPSPINPPSGCPFHTRCPVAMDICKTVEPELKTINNNQTVACHLYEM